MPFNCCDIAFGTPTGAPATYTIRSGDTLSGIAKQFGYSSWREIYDDPVNAAFRQKRPNPDKIFPGDQLILPGRSNDPPLESYSGYIGSGGGGAFGETQFASGGQSNLLGFRAKPPRGDPFDLNYVHPGNVKLRVTLFWVTNCLHIDTSPKTLINKATALFAAHGLSIDIHPGPTRQSDFTIPFDELITTPEQKNGIRLEGAKRFDDQKDTVDKKQRLPVFFCEFKDPDYGLTISGDWLPYVFVSGNLTKDTATLAHEMVHATGDPRHDRAHLNNIMAEVTDNRSEIFKFQVQELVGSYFAK